MGLLQDLRFAVRVLWKKRLFTALVVLTLGLGIGANSAMFSIVKAIVLEPLDVPDIDRLAIIQEIGPNDRRWDDEVSPRGYLDLQQQARSFDALVGYQGWEGSLTGDGEPEQVTSFLVGAGFFDLLGVRPLIGRWFSADEVDGKTENVVILGHHLWMRRYNGDRAIVGKAIQFNDKSYTVVGVMPDRVLFPVPAELWAPLTLSAEERVDRRSHYIGVIGRLSSGVSLEQADAEIRGLGERFAQAFPDIVGGSRLRAVSAVRGVTGELTFGFSMTLMGAAIFVLLIACANVANLFLAHAVSRRRELVVRTALGAGRGRIVRQLLVESSLLGLMGAALSLLFAGWVVDLIKGSMAPRNVRFIAGWAEMGVEPSILGLTLAVGVAVGLIFGVLPALQASRLDLGSELKDESRSTSGPRSHRLRSILVVAQVSLALVLLVGAGGLVTAFRRMADANRGIVARNVLTLRTQLNAKRYPKGPELLEYQRRALAELRALPGIEAAAVTSGIPWGQLGWTRVPVTEGQAARPAREIGFSYRAVTPDYLSILRVPLLEGRHLSAADDRAAPLAAMISATAARTMWPGQPAVGKRFRWSTDDESKPWITVVGVVGDLYERSDRPVPTPTIFLSQEQAPSRAFYVVVRTQGDPNDLARAVSTKLFEIDPNQPLIDVMPLEQVLADDVSGVRLGSSTMAVFALLALLLAAIGIYGVSSTVVIQRTHEIGVRLALGAKRRDVLRLVVGKGMVLTATGVVIGLVLAYALVSVMGDMLAGHVDTGAWLFVFFTVAVTALSFFGSYLPARRAARVDPMIALRHD